MMLTKDTIESLVYCPKTITVKPKKNMYQDQRNNYTMRNDFSCASLDGEYRFEIFMRFNTEIPFCFSVGLSYQSEDKAIIICRYNGKHIHKNKIGDKDEFNDYHIHMLYDHQLADETSDSLDAIVTDKYITFDEALYAFLNDCQIQNWQDCFPDLENKIRQLKIGGV